MCLGNGKVFHVTGELRGGRTGKIPKEIHHAKELGFYLVDQHFSQL